MELGYNKSKPVAVTCMAFPTGDVNNYVVGSEEGTVYNASRHGRFADTHKWNMAWSFIKLIGVLRLKAVLVIYLS